MKGVVGIKALNEERHIARAIESALAAVQPLGGGVILADSSSSDRTVEIASRFPVTIYRLSNPLERGCGTSAQLAFQHVDADYFYLLDGDMALAPDFLAAAIAHLDAHPDCAGVGGQMRELNLESKEYQIRARAAEANSSFRPGPVDRLDGGGLYRVAAIREIGHFADRNLHAFEELELATRLSQAGWTLARIDRHAFDHRGHSIDGLPLLMRRLRSRYADGAGEALRAALRKPHLLLLMRRLGHIRHGAIVMLWWLSLVIAAAIAPFVLPLLLLAPVALLSWRRGSLRLGAYSFATWNVYTIGLIRGLLRRRIPPETPIAAVAIRQADGPDPSFRTSAQKAGSTGPLPKPQTI